MVEGFGTRVARAIEETGPLCAGIDPSASLLDAWGLTDDAVGLREFGLRCIDAFSGVVPVVKPQVAFFERHGSAGLAALETVLARARECGLLVIADAKRADIGNTMDAYAEAWLDPASPLAADALTAVPYLGLGALRPLIDMAAATGRGVIVVVRSSNPEGRTLQESVIDGGTGPAVEDMLLAEIATLNNGGALPAGTLGAVVGATLGRSRFSLPSLGGVILAPGVGAQGGTPARVAELLGDCPAGSVLPSVSRSVLGAGPSIEGLAHAARVARDELAAALA